MLKNSFFVVFLTVSAVAFGSSDYSRMNMHESNPVVQTLADGFSQAGSAVKSRTVSAVDAVVSNVSPYVPQQAVDAKNYVTTSAQASYAWTANKLGQAKNWALPVKQEEKSRFSKAWNATVFGHQGAGKYAIVSTAAAAAIVAAYAAYCFAQPTLEDQVVALVGKAQANPNAVLNELPGILAQCSNDDVRVEVLHFVLSQVEITPEIAAAFNLQR